MQLSNFQKGLVIILAAVCFLGGALFVNRLIAGDVFNKEEAQHAIYSLWLYKDLRALDWGAFWYDTQRQMFWPFFHSWISALFFLVFGVSYFSARLFSLAVFFATLFLTYQTGLRLSDRHGWKIGMLAVIMAFLSPLMIQYSCSNTLEGLGALIFLGSFYFYTICEERKLFYEYVILGVLLGLSIYTNYLYAYLMIPAFVIATIGKLGPLFVEGVHLNRKGEKAAIPFLWWAYKKLIVLAVLLIFVAAWFFTAGFSRKVMLLLQAIFRYSGGVAGLGPWESLIYYPKVIVTEFAFSPWLGIFVLAALFMPFIAGRYRQVNKFYILVWTVLVLAIFTVPTKAPQFIYIIMPFTFLIFSAALFYWLDRVPQYSKALLLVIALPALLSVPALGRLYFPPRPAAQMIEVLNYFRGNILPRYPIAISIDSQRLSPEGIAFHFWDWNAPVLSDPVIGEDEMFKNSQYFLTVEMEPESFYQSEVLDDSLARWNYFLAEKMRLNEVREQSSRRFEGLGLTAKIYVKSGN